MFVYVNLSSLQLGESEYDQQMLSMAESINSKELPCSKEGLISGGTDLYTRTALFNCYILHTLRRHAIVSSIIDVDTYIFCR
jgi:hypothetical protein